MVNFTNYFGSVNDRGSLDPAIGEGALLRYLQSP